MDIKVLSNDFKLRHVIDNAISLSYTECFNDAGTLTMAVPFDKELYEHLKPPARLLVEELIFNVEKLVCTEDKISVYGVGIFGEFKQFYISLAEEAQGKPTDILADLASRVSFVGINYKVYRTTMIDDRVTEVFEWCSDLYKVITQLCYDYDIGFRIVYSFDESELRFIVVTSVDRASAQSDTLTIISDKHGTTRSIESVIDITNYKNRVELIYKINSLGELVSYVYDRTPEGENSRGHIEYPYIIEMTESALKKSFDSYAKRVFKERRKKRYFKATLLGSPMHTMGELCYVESERLGELAYALLVERRVTIIDTVPCETLTLEVRDE